MGEHEELSAKEPALGLDPGDGSGEPPAPGRNGERDFHGETRSNETHASTTDPEARLYRKSLPLRKQGGRANRPSWRISGTF